jgi:GNAT superfamily N-acetyltransferase
MELQIQLLERGHTRQIAGFGLLLNPGSTIEKLERYADEMFGFDNYRCFGLFEQEELIGISSGWITVRFYSGKQLEVDNVIIDPAIQSKGYGKYFFELIEAWAKEKDCLTIELNTYVGNSRSHKFYFSNGYKILGFHFQKQL